MNTSIQNTIENLKKTGYVTEDGYFDLSEEILLAYCKLYHLHSSKNGNGKFDHNFARKLAGINLLKYKFSKGLKHSDIKEGIVYVISNPAWKDYLKVGITKDLSGRLSTYQTSDPHRAFRVDTYEFVLDRKSVEKDLFNRFSSDLAKGEWLKINNARTIIQYVRNTYGIPNSASEMSFNS